VDELKIRAEAVLSLNPELREVFVGIAGSKSPTAAHDLAAAIAKNRGGFAPNEVEEVARATRWLAVIRRDYGDKDFNRVISESSRPRAIVAEAIATVNPNPRAREER